MKNTVYSEYMLTWTRSVVYKLTAVFAKTSPHVLDPPTFALHLGLHFVNKYKHITKAFIDIISLKWSRIPVQGAPHKWSFVRDGEEKGTVECEVDATAGVEDVKATLKVGLKDLLGMHPFRIFA